MKYVKCFALSTTGSSGFKYLAKGNSAISKKKGQQIHKSINSFYIQKQTFWS